MVARVWPAFRLPTKLLLHIRQELVKSDIREGKSGVRPFSFYPTVSE